MIREHENIQEVALNVWALFCGLFPELKETPTPRIVFDRRVKKAYAYASFNGVQFGFKDSIRHYRLYLNEIAGHEIAHVVQLRLYGAESDHHGKEWQELMQMIGLEPKEYY